jgi:RimJ/RimL family protein N-acetyltransferase
MSDHHVAGPDPDAITESTPRLRTERLDLVPLDVGAAAEMAAVLSGPALYEFTGGEPPDVSSLRDRFARLRVGRSADGSQHWHNWIVRIAVDGSAIGTVQATISATEPRAEIAWVIGVPWQGRGYASEAAKALIAWLEAGGISTVIAHIHPDHVASAVVAERAGLHPTEDVEDGERVWKWTASEG